MTERGPAPRFDEIAEREGGLQRSLSSAQLSMIAIGGAIGTGLFLGSRFAIAFAGPAVLLSYAVGGLITLLLMGCLAEMTVAHPTSGSFGAWAEFYLSPLAGFLVRFAYWAGVVFALGTEVSAVAIYMQFWYPAVPGWCWIVGFTLLLVLVNATDVRLFGAIEYSFSTLKIVAILAFLLLGAWVLFSAPPGQVASSNDFRTFADIFPHGVWGAWVAVLVSLFSFFSIEMIAVAAGEAKDPQRAITQAFRATFLRLVLFYLLTLAMILALSPRTSELTGTSESPFVTVMQRTHMPGAAGVVNFVILIAALSAMNSQLYITARMMFSLSRAGFAPRILSRLSGAGVPLGALLVSTIGIGVAAVLNAVYHDAAFGMLLAISMFGPLFVWLMIFVTHLRFRRVRGLHLAQGESRPAFRMWGFPYTTLAGAGLMIAALMTTIFTAAFRPTLLYGVPLLVVLTGAYYARRRKLTAVRSS